MAAPSAIPARQPRHLHLLLGILIFALDLNEHAQHIHLFLQRLLGKTPFVKLKKCAFHQCWIQFLGHIIEEGLIKATPIKVQVAYSSRKQLQKFLSFVNFYRFIKDFSRAADCLP